MNQQLTPEQRKQRIETLVKILGIGAIAFFVAPVILSVIGGLIGLIIAGGISFVAINMVSWFSMVVANWRLKAIKAEAMRNPVETLQNEYAKKVQALDQFKENIRIFAGQVLTFSDQVRQYVKDGLEDADVYKEQLSKMKQLLELRQQKYEEAKQMLQEFAETIQRTDRKWKMACAAAKMNEAAGQIEGDVFGKICIETALDSVQTKLNQSFADLEIALLDDSKQKKSVANQSSVVDLNASPIQSNNRQPISVT